MTGVAHSSRWYLDEVYLAEHEPGLALLVGGPGGRATMTGTMRAPRLDGRMQPFDLVFRYPGQDPYQLPDVYEEAGRFPREPGRHIELSGRLCLWLPVAAPTTEFRRTGGLAVLFDHTRDFLTRQMTYETRQQHGLQPFWTGPEWPHGDDAYTVWAKETLAGLTSRQVTRLAQAAAGPPLALNTRCPCGSRREFGRCHRATVRTLREAQGDAAAVAAVHQLREDLRHG